MKYLIVVVMLIAAFVAGVKYSGGDISTLTSKFNDDKKTTSGSSEAAMCGFGTGKRRQVYASTEKQTAMESCRAELDGATKSVKDNYFCWAESKCPGSKE